MTTEGEDRAAVGRPVTQHPQLPQPAGQSDSPPDTEPVIGHRGCRRLAWVLLAVLVIVLLVTLPPLVNVNRYQRRVASAIAGSIGRPVRFDNIALHMLPLPGFTISNFVVQEDPSFGAEPAMRANVVEARIRVSSLWRRRIEISRIRLQSPTVNLVRNPGGLWNLQGVVTQAAQVPSAPTAQQQSSAAPRFPYIEATDARINLKLGETKMPYSLVDAEFALWLPTEQEWHLRLDGRPLRTDTDVSDVGQLRLEATLGRHAGQIAQAPFSLEANWKPTPMGEASKLFLGRDTGWRGTASAAVTVQGTPAAMHLSTDLHVHNLRRAEFVPAEAIELDAHCETDAMGVLHQLGRLHCTLPTVKSTSLLDALPFGHTPAPAGSTLPDELSLDAEVPNALDWTTASAHVGLQKGSPEWLLRWMRLFSSRISPSLHVEGAVSARIDHQPGQADPWTAELICRCTLPAPASSAAAAPVRGIRDRENSDPSAKTWLLIAAHLPGTPDETGRPAALLRMVSAAALPAGDVTASVLHPANELTAQMPIAGRVDGTGTLLRYRDQQIASYAALLVPPLGDGMPQTAPAGALESQRPWTGPQQWASPASPVPRSITRHRIRSHAH